MSQKTSSIPSLDLPDFKPNIPEYMLNDVDKQSERYLIEQMSVMTQQSAWQTHKLMNIYDYTRSINGKVIELEQFRNDLLSQITVEQKVEQEQQKHTRNYKIVGLVFLSLVYPVYLAIVNSTGLSDIVKKLLFVIS